MGGNNTYPPLTGQISSWWVNSVRIASTLRLFSARIGCK
jgi:hypothetical protein